LSVLPPAVSVISPSFTTSVAPPMVIVAALESSTTVFSPTFSRGLAFGVDQEFAGVPVVFDHAAVLEFLAPEAGLVAGRGSSSE
jgi:hypothetical protein